MTKKSCLLFCYNKLGGDFKWADQKAEKTNLGPKKKDLETKHKPGNKYAALWTSKSLTEEERLRLIIQKQEIEIERLKKGYLTKGVGVNKEFVTIQDVSSK